MPMKSTRGRNLGSASWCGHFCCPAPESEKGLKWHGLSIVNRHAAAHRICRILVAFTSALVPRLVLIPLTAHKSPLYPKYTAHGASICVCFSKAHEGFEEADVCCRLPTSRSLPFTISLFFRGALQSRLKQLSRATSTAEGAEKLAHFLAFENISITISERFPNCHVFVSSVSSHVSFRSLPE